MSPHTAEVVVDHDQHMADAEREEMTAFGVTLSLLKRNMYLFIWLKAIGSYDSGAFSAVLAVENGISVELGLSTSDKGDLAASVFLGNIIGCPIAGHLFSNYDERWVLNMGLIGHTIATFLFATFPVYTPVWVDNFAPKDRKSIWMASHNAGVPLGIMFGYLAGMYFPSYTSIAWEWAFYLKCLLMLPTIAYVTFVDPRSMNTVNRNRGVDGAMHSDDTSEAATEEAPGSGSRGPRGLNAVNANNNFLTKLKYKATGAYRSFSPLLTNPVYMLSVLAMSAMYLVATGLQNFVTDYIKDEPFNASVLTIMVGFGAAVVTSPVLGVICGGVLLDRFGGYHGNLYTTSAFAAAWGMAASFFAIICIFVTSTGWFLIVMSCVLFCGGAIIPPGAGLTMATLPTHMRSIGAAFAQTMYNLLGNYSGPLLCGYVAEWTGKLKYGIDTLLLCSILGVIPMSCIVLIAWREMKKKESMELSSVVVETIHSVSHGGGTGGAVDELSGSQEISPNVNRDDHYGENEDPARNTVNNSLTNAMMRSLNQLEDCTLEEEVVVNSVGDISASERQHDISPHPIKSQVDSWKKRNLRAQPIQSFVSVIPHQTGTVESGRGSSVLNFSTPDGHARPSSAVSPSLPSLRQSPQTDSIRATLSTPNNNETLLDLIEDEIHQEKSIPNQHGFGMDVVYSWLSSEAETKKRQSANNSLRPSARTTPQAHNSRSSTPANQSLSNNNNNTSATGRTTSNTNNNNTSNANNSRQQ